MTEIKPETALLIVNQQNKILDLHNEAIKRIIKLLTEMDETQDGQRAFLSENLLPRLNELENITKYRRRHIDNI